MVEFAAMSLLVTYLTEVREEKLVQATATVNVLEGFKSVLVVPATFLQHRLGCYSVVNLSAIIHSMGLGILCISAFAWTEQGSSIQIIEAPLFYLSLVLVAVGKAGSSSSLEVFLEKQLKAQSNNIDDEIRDETRKTVSLARCNIIGTLLGNLLLLILDKWIIRFGVSALVIRFTIGWFLIGTPLYILNTIERSERAGHNIDGYFRGFKGNFRTAAGSSPSSNSNNLDQERIAQRRLRTTSRDQVKGTKTHFLSILPICLTFLLYGVVTSIGKTFFLLQGYTMDRGLGGDGADNTGIINDTLSTMPLTIVLIIMNVSRFSIRQLVDHLFSKRLSGRKQMYVILIRIGFGMLFSVICCSTAQLVEVKRLNVVNENNLLDEPDELVPLSLFWLVPQFISLGIVKGLAGDGLEEFLEDELPDPKKSYASAFSETVIGVGTLLSVCIVKMSEEVSSLGGRPSWFAENINRSRLDKFYRTLTILCLLNLFIYSYISTRYTYTNKRLTHCDVSEENVV